MKRMFVILLAAMLFSAVALADTPVVEKTVYEGLGVVDVDFVRDVQFQDLTLTVLDAQGNAVAAVIRERDDDEVTFRLEDVLPGDYSYTLLGLRSGFSGEYGSVSGSFTIPEETRINIKKVEYDLDDREIDVEFFSRVSLENARITVLDASGAELPVTLRELDGDGFEAYVPGLVRGESYTLEVRDVNDGLQTGNASFEFVARDD